jgi:hypothetical protein
MLTYLLAKLPPWKTKFNTLIALIKKAMTSHWRDCAASPLDLPV